MWRIKIKCRSLLLACSLAWLWLAVAQISSADNEDPVSELCLHCLCEAASGCNLTKICIGEVCGPFYITKRYWAHAGNFTVPGEEPHEDQAYANCSNDVGCAGRTIQGYMREFAQDCNGDDSVDCYDYAAIHRLGGHGCQGVMPAPFSQRLQRCLNETMSQKPVLQSSDLSD